MVSIKIYSVLPRRIKQLIFAVLDILMLSVALWSSFALRFSDFWPYERMQPFWWMFPLISILGVITFARLDLYRVVTRFIGDYAVWSIVKGVMLLGLIMYGTAYLAGVNAFPRSIPINFVIISILYLAGSRYLVKLYYHVCLGKIPGKERVIVYGAGDAGTQYSQLLRKSSVFNQVAFIDDDLSLHGRLINGIPVYSLDEARNVIYGLSATRVILAIPAASAFRRKQIVENLRSIDVNVQTLPSLDELASGTSTFDTLREIDLDNLLGREVVAPNKWLLRKEITNKVIMVTGAGGSIGSELCRQIIKLSPQHLILYENSEFQLYTVGGELSCLTKKFGHENLSVTSVLGSVLDYAHLDKVVQQYNVQSIFHAAAYKHVPIVEQNISEGVRNNLIGTKVVAEVALHCGVERCVLISTDKAVRPTSVMGASKRAAEQIIQCMASKQGKTIYSIVRFGNVLGSSGSVVPLFRKQISDGGPVTVTHKDITRYFMSVSEAAQLVIQAGAMAMGGEVFVLDMKKPVKIYDLARNMIELSGHKVRDESSPDGDVEIVCVGLRPGEKLHEELFIGEQMSGTEHPQIMRASEDYLEAAELFNIVDDIEKMAANYDEQGIVGALQRIVKEYYSPERL